MPDRRDEVRLPDGKLVVAVDAGSQLDTLTLARISQIMEERKADIVVVWVNGEPAVKVTKEEGVTLA